MNDSPAGAGFGIALEGVTATYTSAVSIVGSGQGQGIGMTGVLLTGTTLTTDRLTINGAIAATQLAINTDNAGVIIAGTAISTSGSTTITGDGGDSSGPFGTSNHGVVISGSASIDRQAQFVITGTGGMNAEDSHGVFISGSLLLTPATSASLAFRGTAGGPLSGSLSSKNLGIFLTGSIDNQGTLEYSGICLDTECHGIELQSTFILNGADVTMTGDCSPASSPGIGFNCDSTTSIDLLSGTNTLSIDGTGGGGGGSGVEWDCTMSGTAVTALGISGMGGGGNTDSTIGTFFKSPVVFPGGATVTVYGRGGGGNGAGNVGVKADASINAGGSISVTGDGGAGSGAGNHGVQLVSDCDSSGSVVIGGNALSSAGQMVGVIASGQITAGGSVLITATAPVSAASTIGCLVEGHIDGTDTVNINCSTAGTSTNSHGLQFAPVGGTMSIEGSSMSLSGTVRHPLLLTLINRLV